MQDRLPAFTSNPIRAGAAALGLVAVGVVLAWDLLFWESISPDFANVPESERFFFDAGAGNHLLGCVLAVWLLWRRRARFMSLLAPPKVPAGIGLFGLVLSMGLRAWSAWSGVVELQLPALALLALSIGLTAGGTRGLKLMAAPAAVMVLSMPIPLAIVNGVIHEMQLMTASIVATLLDGFSIQHALFGEQIRTPKHVFYVIEGCAGLRTLQSITFATVLYLEFLFRSVRQAAIILLASIGVAILVNLFRVLTIVLAPESGVAKDHTLQGLSMISLGIVLIAIIDVVLQRFEGAEAEDSEDASSSQPVPAERTHSVRGPGLRRGYWTCGAAIIAYGLVGIAMPSWTATSEKFPVATALPARLEGFRAVRTILPDREYFGSVVWSDQVNRIYSRNSDFETGGNWAFEVLVLVDDPVDRGTNILSTKTARAKPGYRVLRQGVSSLFRDGRGATSLELQSVYGREAVLHWYKGVRPTWGERWRTALGFDQGGFAGHERGLAIRVSTQFTSNSLRDVTAQEAALRELAIQIDQALDEVGMTRPLNGI